MLVLHSREHEAAALAWVYAWCMCAAKGSANWGTERRRKGKRIKQAKRCTTEAGKLKDQSSHGANNSR